MARALLTLVSACLVGGGGCVVAPPPDRPPPPRGARSWETPPLPRDEAFELRLGDVVFTFPALSPMLPPGGVERGESFAGVGIDLLGLGVAIRGRARPTPRPAEPEDAPTRAWRDLRDDLERSLEQVQRAAERHPPESP
ncbi:MAG: hypothetical protein M9894_36890 [Planctomycetes bacterium]|nr:hypothetical protein [Planctomycetota bacterium]